MLFDYFLRNNNNKILMHKNSDVFNIVFYYFHNNPIKKQICACIFNLNIKCIKQESRPTVYTFFNTSLHYFCV